MYNRVSSGFTMSVFHRVDASFMEFLFSQENKYGGKLTGLNGAVMLLSYFSNTAGTSSQFYVKGKSIKEHILQSVSNMTYCKNATIR